VTKPKALHLAYGLDFGGVESHMRLIAENQDGRYAHEFCAIGPGGAAKDAIVRAGGTAEALGCEPWRRPLSSFGSVLSLLRRVRPEVVHTHGAEANLFGLPASRLAGVRVRIGEEIGLPSHSRKAWLAYKSVYSLAHRVIGISDSVRHFLVSSGEVPEKKAVRIYNPGRFPQVRARERAAGQPFRLGFVGRLSPEKNACGLARALLRLLAEGENVELVLVGSGPERPMIERLARAAGGRILAPGYLENPFDLIATCHLYVQPSLSEGFGLALVEAMAMGLPVIASGVGGAREIIEDGRTGWILDDVSDEAIAAEILRVMALEPRHLVEIGSRAAISVKERFAPEAYIRKIEDLYDEVRSERANPKTR
jgi:glycosyltransferase involved in cell wall biosynthesis